MITITLENSKSQISGPAKETLKMYKHFKLRNPGAFFLRAHMPKGWDGKIDYITDRGYFSTGLLTKVVAACKEFGYKVKLEDNRDTKFLRKAKVATSAKGYIFRPYQVEAIKAVVEYEVEGIRNPRVTLKPATNAGKTLISAGIHLSYPGAKTLYLMNSKELYDQALVELPEYLDCSIGYIQGKHCVWGDFMVVMVPTLRSQLKSLVGKLANYKIAIIDECDLADNKSNKLVIQALYNTVVRVGMSGTIFQSKLAKDKPKNMNLEGFFGPLVYEISNRDLIDLGHSSEVRVKAIEGNVLNERIGGGWQQEYTELIVHNTRRNRKVVRRCTYHWNKGRTNQLVIAQRHEHIVLLVKAFEKAKRKGELPESTRIDWVHHDRKDRAKVVTAFLNGEIDILIGSMILKRGKNFKKMKFMINAGAGKSPENIVQLLGRAFRGCKYYEDFFDQGFYMKKWSRKRFIYYKNEKLQVINRFK